MALPIRRSTFSPAVFLVRWTIINLLAGTLWVWVTAGTPLLVYVLLGRPLALLPLDSVSFQWLLAVLSVLAGGFPARTLLLGQVLALEPLGLRRLSLGRFLLAASACGAPLTAAALALAALHSAPQALQLAVIWLPAALLIGIAQGFTLAAFLGLPWREARPLLLTSVAAWPVALLVPASQLRFWWGIELNNPGAVLAVVLACFTALGVAVWKAAAARRS